VLTVRVPRCFFRPVFRCWLCDFERRRADVCLERRVGFCVQTVNDVVDCVHRILFGEGSDARSAGWRSPMDSILAELLARRAVLVFDHVDGLEKYDDFKLFLGGMLDRTKGLRILVIVHSRPGQPLTHGGVPGACFSCFRM